MKSSNILLLLCFLFGSHIGFAQKKKVAKKNPPNIILILADDQGWSELSVPMDPRIPVSHSEYLETPNIARLAKEGMRFTSGYAPAPLCTPTRRSILCGTSAARSGEEFPSPKWVSANHTTLPRIIKQANPAYKTAHFGKWGGKDMINTPEECGYDESNGVTGNPDGDLKVAGDPKSGIMGKPAEREYFTNDDPKATTFVTNSAIRFMQEQTKARNPFYMQVSYYAVHLAVVAREETVEKYRKKGPPDRGYSPAFAAMTEDLDAGVGRLLKEIDKLGIGDNTYVIYTADNGGRDKMPFRKSDINPNFPLTGAKQDILEGGIRVPFFVRGPGIKAGSFCHTPVAGYDFLPTFYALAGGKGQMNNEIDGGNIATLFKNPNGKVVRQTNGLIFSRPENGFSCIRQGDYKLMIYWDNEGKIKSRTLHKLNPDPVEEGKDISSKNKQKADQLQETLMSYLKSVNAQTARSAKKPRGDEQ